MCSAAVLCAWRRLPLIFLKLLVVVCVRHGFAAFVCVCRLFAASVDILILPRGWRAVAFPRRLHVQSCSTWLILIVRCCFGGLCVRDGLASSVSVCHTSASVEPLLRGLHAVAFSRWLNVLSHCDVAHSHCSLLHR